MPAHSCSFTHTQLNGTGWSAAKMAKDAFPAKPVPQGARVLCWGLALSISSKL